MSRTLLSLACHTYGVAAFVYLSWLVRQWRPLSIAGRVLVGSALLMHGVGLSQQILAQGGAPTALSTGLSFVAFVLLAIFFVLDLRYQLPVAGAFLLPAALAVLVPSFLVDNPSVLEAGVRKPLLPLHVAVALAGVGAFAAATAVAVMYLLMERQVKGKKFGLLFSRLPSLQMLDELNRKLVVFGFIALSVTLITGAFFVSGVFWQWQAKEVATVVAWVVFAAVLNARVFAGWQGKRVAVLTMMGFCLLVVSFLSSYAPAAAIAAAGVR